MSTNKTVHDILRVLPIHEIKAYLDNLLQTEVGTMSTEDLQEELRSRREWEEDGSIPPNHVYVDGMGREYGRVQVHSEYQDAWRPKVIGWRAQFPGRAAFASDYLFVPDPLDKEVVLDWIEHAKGSVEQALKEMDMEEKAARKKKRPPKKVVPV